MNKNILLTFTFIFAFSIAPPLAASRLLARAEPAPELSIAAANNEFAVELYDRLKGETGNILFSPVSVSTALAMTAEGARGKTADEMQAVFHFPADARARRAVFAALIKGLHQSDSTIQLDMANALWAQKGHKFLKEYLAVLRRDYSGQAAEVDFKNAAEKARQTINRWVEQKTHRRIKDLFSKGSLNALSRLVLTNAVYFKGKWVDPFEKSETTDQYFRIGAERFVKVRLMKKTGERFGYAETEGVQILEMGYQGDRLSMVVLLPTKDNLGELESSLSAEQLGDWIGQIENKRVDIFIPKFTFGEKYSLSQTLAAMGMPTAFTDEADFSGMDGTHNLSIQKVIHQTFVDVSEQGTEAAAATGISLGATAMMPEPVPVFRADHPFLFLIRDTKTGTILFLGRVSNPL